MKIQLLCIGLLLVIAQSYYIDVEGSFQVGNCTDPDCERCTVNDTVC